MAGLHAPPLRGSLADLEWEKLTVGGCQAIGLALEFFYAEIDGLHGKEMLGRSGRSRRGSGEHRPGSTGGVCIAVRADRWASGAAAQAGGDRAAIVRDTKSGRDTARPDAIRTTAGACPAVARGASTAAARTAAGGARCGAPCCGAPCCGARASRCAAAARAGTAAAGSTYCGSRCTADTTDGGTGCAGGSAYRGSRCTADGSSDRAGGSAYRGSRCTAYCGSRCTADTTDGGTGCAGGSAYCGSRCTADTTDGSSDRAGDTAYRAGHAANLSTNIPPAAQNGE